MEAVPKLPLISFELKLSPEKTYFSPRLKQYITEAYKEDCESYSNELHQLESLRSAAVRPSIDAAGLSALIRYFCQLRALQSRFPMAKGQPASCIFHWKDLYANMNCSLSDVRFEMACILYNIGALHTQLGSAESRATPDSLKATCQHYQFAAWAFQHLTEQYPQPPGADVSTDILCMLQDICFAQAQECILDKSIQDTRKSSVVGAVATQVLYYYRNALSQLGPSGGSDNIHEIIGTKQYNSWHRYLSFKISYIGCIVCLYQGINAEELQKMGERVAFYQQAIDKLAEARKLAKYIEPVQVTQEALTFTNDVVEGKRKAAKNENEFIYHEEVPDKDMLTDLKPVSLVKALAINFNDPEISGPDIFARLVPMGAHEASSMYSEVKANLLRLVVSQVGSKDRELTEFLSSMQLKQLDVLDSDQKIPQEIVDRCAAMNAKTDIIQSLVDSMNSLAEVISDVELSLNEIKSLIQEETLKEKEYQKQMGPRPPSIVQTEISREHHKYQEAHARTSDSNQVLHKAMTLHIANLRLLAQPLEVLQHKIPSIENIEGLDRSAMLEMRRVVGKAHEMRVQRDALVQQLRAALADDDVTTQLLARASEPQDHIFRQEIEKHSPTVKIIEQNLAAQENIINKLTSLYASYGDSRRLLSDVLRKRDGLINALITSYDTHSELLGKSQKGLEFYKKLSHNVNSLLARLRSVCQVQEEERSSMMAKQQTPSPAISTTPKPADAVPKPSSGGGLKLKDYLPYMKNRNAGRNLPPQAHLEHLPADTYYSESIYPTSVRPTPVGSEATDMTQPNLPDGVVMPPQMQNMSNPYNRYSTSYASESESYAPPASYAYSTSKYTKPEESYNYSSYIPPQYMTQVPDTPNMYSNPYYSAINSNATTVTESSNTGPYKNIVQNDPPSNQYGYVDPYMSNQVATPEAATSPLNPVNQDFNTNFSQMHVSVPKSEPLPTQGISYTQAQYGGQYPQTYTPNVPTYSHARPSSSMPQNIPTEYPMNNSYTSDSTAQYAPTVPNVSTAYPSMAYNVNQNVPDSYSNLPQVVPNVPNPMLNPESNISNVIQSPTSAVPNISNAYSADQYPYSSAYESISQGYVYTNAESPMTSTTNTSNATFSAAQAFIPNEPSPYIDPNLSQIDSMDRPIKSHVTGQAFSTTIPRYHQYNTSIGYTGQNSNPTYQQTNMQYAEQSNYGQNYQNHPGYTYNANSGSYDYTYGSQASYTSYGTGQPNVAPQSTARDPNWNQAGVYTSAGGCDTVQSPSENPQIVPQVGSTDNQIYYNLPYGYQAGTSDIHEVPQSMPPSTNNSNNLNNLNNSTYMQSVHTQDTSVTYTSNQVSTTKENIPEPTYVQNTNLDQSNTVQPDPEEICHEPETNQEPEINPTITKTEEPILEPTNFDLLSDIDFSVEQSPLKPEIKVPQISEKVIVKPNIIPKIDPVKIAPKEEVIVRPPKRDLFSDPSLLNTFTQGVKDLQRLTDSLTNKTSNGLTILDSKWKTFQEVQAKENMSRSKKMATQYTKGNVVTAAVPYDDTRLTLISDPNVYINASYYKQLSPWCIPIVISKCPEENETGVFWRAMLENKINCVVCLQSEIEMQGKFYWPTAKGQSLDLDGGVCVTLEDVNCTVHWTERSLTISVGRNETKVTHYQINVYPAKVVCPPLVLLADRVAARARAGGACLQCGPGAGRSAALALLLLAVCQVRAGRPDLIDMLDAGCVELCKRRTNVLEDPKYLADVYRTVLYYAQGVLCSGTTSFNGETISLPSGADFLPLVPPSPAVSSQKQKFSRESFEEMRQAPGLKSGDMKDPLNFLDPLWSLKKK